MICYNNDLQIGYTDSAGDLITIQGQQFSATTVEQLQLNSGNILTNTDINQVISSMSAYASSHSISLTSLNDVKNSPDLMAIVNGAWHAA